MVGEGIPRKSVHCTADPLQVRSALWAYHSRDRTIQRRHGGGAHMLGHYAVLGDGILVIQGHPQSDVGA